MDTTRALNMTKNFIFFLIILAILEIFLKILWLNFEFNISRDLIFLHIKDEVLEFLKHYQTNRLGGY